MSEAVVIGVDVGATKILVGAITQTGEILDSRRSPVNRESRPTRYKVSKLRLKLSSSIGMDCSRSELVLDSSVRSTRKRAPGSKP